MGLDMYLTKEFYVGAEYEHRKVSGTVEIFIDGVLMPIEFDKISEITLKVGYWRKANAIHQWFVENVQDDQDDCKRYEVTREQLQALLDLVELVLEHIKLEDGKVTNGYTFKNGVKTPILEDGKVVINSEFAEEYLPTTSGFFFGGTDYDQYYVYDLEITRDMLRAELAIEYPKQVWVTYYYQSSW